MDYHEGFESYLDAKKNIVARASKKDYLVYNPDYPDLKQMAAQSKTKNVPFIGSLPFENKAIPLLGKHNIDNVRAAVTVARVLSIPDEISEKAVRKFKSLPHRLQLVGIYKGTSFCDDAISTTPESTMAAINSFPQVGTILLGGKDRGYDFAELVREIAKHAIPNLVLFPETDRKIIAELKKNKDYSPRVLKTTKMEEAVKFAFENSAPGSTCILSPASPSYNLWKNFEAKGDEFQKFVKELSTK